MGGGNETEEEPEESESLRRRVREGMRMSTREIRKQYGIYQRRYKKLYLKNEDYILQPSSVSGLVCSVTTNLTAQDS